MPNHPPRRQDRANCSLHAARERSEGGGVSGAVLVVCRYREIEAISGFRGDRKQANAAEPSR